MTTPQLSIEDALKLLEGLSPIQRKEVEKLVDEQTGHLRWIPNPGPQTMAYGCMADEVLYGGAAGGGKTQLLVGKALQKHKRSLILRRLNAEVEYLVDITEEILGHTEGYAGQHKRWYLPQGRLIMFGGAQNAGDERKYRGEPKDFIGIDEAAMFLESQVDFVMQWLRTKDPNQHVQLLLASNPPEGTQGEWLTRWFGPWVDPDHPLYPQADGELLYYRRMPAESGMGNEFEWFTSPLTYTDEYSGEPVTTPSRTFIRANLDDNPEYAGTGYRSRLAAGPQEIKERLLGGAFTTEPVDEEFQVIPTKWVMEAQARWKDAMAQRPGPPANTAMTAMGVDVAQGGKDRFIIAPRYGDWYDNLIVRAGKDTPDGPSGAGHILTHLRDAAQVNIDMGGGWGGSVYDFLKGNNAVSIYGFVPSGSAMGKSADGKYRFRNIRAEAYWRFREALDPYGQHRICLPPDSELKQELCAHHRKPLGPDGLLTIQEKSEIIQAIGRSPDKADAVIIAWYTGRNRLRPRGGNYGTRGGQQPLQTRTNEGYRSTKRDRYRDRGTGGPPGRGEGEHG